MQLQTTVDTPTFPFEITHHHKITFIGSCFASNIGQQFAHNKFNSLINPYGVLYNPASVSQCINSVLSTRFDEKELIEHDGLWHSFAHHGSFSNADKNTCITNINKHHDKANIHLLNSDFLFLTFGTAHIFEYQGAVVSNCHKLPSKKFTHRRLSVDEIVTIIKGSIANIHQENPKLKIIFTLSPVRYPKEGMNTNSLSKATLLLAIEKLCQMENCYYFPAYEIVLDELRDYRFFAEDMIHPNNTAIAYLWGKIENSCFNTSTLQLSKQINKITTASQHRPFNSNPDAHQQFLSTMLKKASDLQNKYPEIDLSAEIAYFQKKEAF